jgi:hypothetical protein
VLKDGRRLPESLRQANALSDDVPVISAVDLGGFVLSNSIVR